MRVCVLCKKQEGTNHSGRCSYYWGLIANSEMPVVTLRTALVEDDDGCPLVKWDKPLDAECDGCVECIPGEEL